MGEAVKLSPATEHHPWPPPALRVWAPAPRTEGAAGPAASEAAPGAPALTGGSEGAGGPQAFKPILALKEMCRSKKLLSPLSSLRRVLNTGTLEAAGSCWKLLGAAGSCWELLPHNPPPCVLLPRLLRPFIPAFPCWPAWGETQLLSSSRAERGEHVCTALLLQLAQ